MQYFGFDRPSFGIKTYGFGESSPKLQADFTTGTYKASGATKTFADLFTFNRAGKAWLVKDTGLVEYAIDTPRFDSGLLIEQEATNYGAWSLLPEGGSYVKARVAWNGSGWGYLSDGTDRGAYLYPQPYPDTSLGRIFSYRFFGGAFNTIRTGALTLEGVTVSNILYSIVPDAQVNNVSGVVYSEKSSDGRYPKYWQVENLNSQLKPTSHIVTTTTPVTRPADFLLNKITGTTVTGDWDSTLTLSIVNGQLVHSGYGRIRSLEIN